MNRITRSSGILLHITSLPSPYGIGSMGKAAFDFIDFLKIARQTYWQILPTCPPGYGNSPYQAFSSFAGNPYLIDLDLLVKDKLLLQEELPKPLCREIPDQVDFPLVYQQKDLLFSIAFHRFQANIPEDYHIFLQENQAWLSEYALFMAIKEYFGNVSWQEWETNIRYHRPHAVAHYRAMLNQQINYHYFLQYIFYRQWEQLRTYAHKNGIKIIGDIPFYVPLDCTEVWSNAHQFQLSNDRKPTVVAGCPPDSFNENGQYWGNPIYDWDVMERDGFRWWLQRIGAAVKNFDIVRIDHFRGIESYWSIPASGKTAREGHWVKGPGMRLISAIQKTYPNAIFIAEDLGFLTPEVQKLVRASGFPGMKILEFAFDPREPSDYLPHKYTENCICYTGTHDNETLSQWCAGISKESQLYARKYLGISADEDLPKALVLAGMHSRANVFIAQMQDYLYLGKDARMNEPGTVKPENWRWRILPNAASTELAHSIAVLTISSRR